MRAVAAGLVASCLLAAGGNASAATEWVVLRVERVEVAVAHADGTPWDERNDPGLDCGAGADELMSSPSWGPVVKAFCFPRGGDPTAPDLRIRLVAGSADYLSPIATNVLGHTFMYEVLVPLEAVPADGLAIEVIDQDGSDPRSGEVLGSVHIKVADIKDLLASSARIKTRSDDAVTRLELTAHRYTRAALRKVRVDRKRRVARFAGGVIAGELVELRAAKGATFPTAVIGGSLDRLITGRCMIALVQTSGPIAAGLDDDDQPASLSFGLRVLEPSVAQWTRSRGWTACYATSTASRTRPQSVVTVGPVAALGQSTLDASAVQKIIDSRYHPGVQRCHERALAKDGMLVGRARLWITVGPTGGVAKSMLKGFDPTVDTCIHELTTRWRFGAPKDANGKPTSADFEAPLTLDVR